MISQVMGCLFTDRTGTASEAKARVLLQIKEKQIAAEEGRAARLHIFPEGATTTGKHVLSFKKGAFAALRPVQPLCIKYWSLVGRVSHGDAIHWLGYMICLY